MKLRNFKAEHYRSLRDFDLDIDDFTVLIGENNHGKSNFFYALDLLLSSTVKGVDSGICFNHDMSRPVVLTARFEELTPYELGKLKPWTVNGSLTISKEYTFDESGRVTADYYAVMRVPEEEWLDEDFADYSKREVVGKLPIAPYLPQTGRITKEEYRRAIRRFIDEHPDKVRYKTERRKNPAGYKQVLDGYLPELYLVPAVRDIADETKAATTTTLLGRVLGVVVRRIARQNPAFQELQQAVENLKRLIEGEKPEDKVAEVRELESRLTKELSTWGVGVNISVEVPDIEQVFQLGTTVTLDDGLQTDVSRKGHGLQRSLLFALIRVWAAESRRSTEEDEGTVHERSVIFAFEEPELFLHPQIARATYDALREISATDQVLLCSHSPYFVNLEDYKHIAIIRKPSLDMGTKAFRVMTDLFEGEGERKKRFNMMQFFNPDRNELFFARKIVLVEGPTEKAALPALARRLGCFDHRVSVIDCGGKNNLTLYMTVLNAFSIPYLVLHDEDAGPEAEKENESIREKCDPSRQVRVFKPNFDVALGVSQSDAERLGKPYAAISLISDESWTVPEPIAEIVRCAYDLSGGSYGANPS
jgi:putative ATP-dependent endonuclease of OLD family